MQCFSALGCSRVQRCWRSQRATSHRHSVSVVNSSSARPKVVVTREKGKNAKMISALAQRDVDCIELPLIVHAPGPDKDKLPGLLKAGGFDWVAVTSPEAAAVYLKAWQEAGSPEVRVAVVGLGTGAALKAAGVEPGFTATKALGKIMGKELPKIPGGTNVVLYPSSVRAGSDLQDSLTGNGFTVHRVHTYDTVGVKEAPAEVLQSALDADAITFGSPSAVKAWVSLVGIEAARQVPSVCIGSTSAKACWNAGLTKVTYAEDPGIPGWVECVLATLKEPQLA